MDNCYFYKTTSVRESVVVAKNHSINFETNGWKSAPHYLQILIPSIKQMRKLPKDSVIENELPIKLFKRLLKNNKTDVFPISLMDAYFRTIACNYNLMIQIYKMVFQKHGINKYPLIISSMRFFKDESFQRTLLLIAKNQKYSKYKRIREAILSLEEYWK